MINRRRYIIGLGTGSVVGLMASLCSRRAAAQPSTAEAVLPASPPAQTAAGRIWVSSPNCYFNYPHSNSFLPTTGNPVLAKRGGQKVKYFEWDFRAGTERTIVETAISNTYWDIAEGTGRLFFVDKLRRIISVQAQGGASDAGRAVTHLAADQDIEALLSVNASGSKILYAVGTRSPGGQVNDAKLLELALSGTTSSLLCDMQFDADHQHYCPHDESWIGFAHEGDIRKSLDRVWGVHEVPADGKPEILWNERSGDNVFLAGHERWVFHKTAALVVAYPTNLGHPTGLYLVDPVKRAAQLISASNYDWHCNIDRTGTWAVVDTSPPGGHEREPDGRLISDIVLVNMRSGQRQWVARSHADPHGHPYHPHPHFTPDGRYLVFNDFQRDGAGKFSRVVVQEIKPS